MMDDDDDDDDDDDVNYHEVFACACSSHTGGLLTLRDS